MLKIENFSKSYDGGKTFAVKNLSLEVKPGTITAFIGHNGSGKSTTLKSIAGIIGFDEGDIWVNGINVKQDAMQVKKLIGYLPETIELYEYLTGIQFLNFIADVFGLSKQERQQNIEKYAKLFNMQNALTLPIETYSHGMKQKIAVIALLIHNPLLLLLDEPFFGLDPQSTFDFKQIMQELVKNGCAIFYSTHVLDTAEKLATDVIIIKKGQIVKQGKTSQLIKDKSLEKLFLEIANE
jgi:ABC-2 type transport system ATP-binding protein